MNINATQQTSTFPCPVNKLKGRLADNIGLTWHTEFGQFKITKQNILWIMRNVKESMYNNERCYIYNKAFYEAFFNPHHTPQPELKYDTSVDKVPDRFELIRIWAKDRGLYDKGNSHTQYVKLQEEAGELAQAILKQDKPEIIDAIGDMVVVLTNLAHLEGFTIEDCIDSAYTEIATRKGKMLNGTFVKETL
jgi:NTP pyrophosphatase (non-canonical NTP hydrolase)